ncbi:MAG: RluA family pseudouridine synthase [Thermodesulfobacteriota bacterium]
MNIPYLFTARTPDVRKRLDHFLVEQRVPFSRSQIKKWIDEGRLSVNGRAEKGGYRLKEGDCLTFSPGEPVPLSLTPEAIPLKIVFEDQDLLVLDKPAGLVVHPAAGNFSGTLVHALLHHCSDLSGIGGVMRPGIVHRLDKDTSGLMVVAKNDSSHQDLIRQFQKGGISKEYQALVWGGPAILSGRIEKPIGRHPVHRKKMAVNEKQGKAALTEWEVLERFSAGVSLLKLIIKTGRTHQIRVHLSSQGWPVVGDPLYGGKKSGLVRDKELPEALASLMTRQLLHAYRLAFYHPTQGNLLDFSSCLPEDMEAALKVLRLCSDNKR